MATYRDNVIVFYLVSKDVFAIRLCRSFRQRIKTLKFKFPNPREVRGRISYDYP